jgi:SsrA-binding protein
MSMGEKIIVTNRRAGREYQVLDRIEAGVALVGTEVKSLRMKGSITLKDAYADIQDGEVFLVGAHIEPYEKGNIYNHEPERSRKLLMHKRDILRLAQRIAEKGLTLVPLKVYFKNGIVKIELGVCRGKHSYDKRDTIRERDTGRDMERQIKEARRGSRND